MTANAHIPGPYGQIRSGIWHHQWHNGKAPEVSPGPSATDLERISA